MPSIYRCTSRTRSNSLSYISPGRRSELMKPRTHIAVLLGAAAAVLMTACGAEPSTKPVTAVKTTPAPSTAASQPAKTTTKQRRLKHVANKSTAATRACDQNIAAKVGTTSCEFAENVFWAYWHAWESGDSTFTAYSPVTQREYDVSCSSGALVICRAADGAEVRFPLSAVR